MHTVELLLLGMPELRVDGRVFRVRTRKMLALLAYLAVEPGPHPREELAALLWRSVTGEARAGLRLTLYHLQQVLGHDALLHVSSDSVELPRRAGLWIDVVALEAHAASHSDSFDPAALDLWRGDFLHGLTISASPAWDDWVSARMRSYAERFDSLLARHAHAQLTAGQGWEAISTARQRIQHDRVNQDAYRQLARAQQAAGLQADALRTERRFQEVLRGELGVDPNRDSAETALIRPPGRAAVTAELPPFLVEGSLIGREVEFGQLAHAYHRAAAGTPQAALLSGEPGIGKTRLAGELLAWAHSRQALTLWGRTLETAGQPFAPLVEALGRAELGPDAGLTVLQLNDLALLLPGLMSGPALSGSSDVRYRLLDALSAMILTLAPVTTGEQPLVLLIDDLQWADASSLDALLHLAARLGEVPVPLLLVFTARSEFVGTGTPLAGWLARLRRHLPLLTVQVEPLNADDTRHLLNSVLPRIQPPSLQRLSAWLFSQTGGHPLYLKETIKSLLESGAIRSDAQGIQITQAFLPDLIEGVRAAIGERLARLSPASLSLAQAAAVLGRDAKFDELRQIADLDDPTALHAYEALVRCGLLVELGGRGGRQATLSHARVRDTVLATLSGARRLEWHRRTFLILAARHAPPATLAEHATLAGMEPEAAIMLERAATAARDVGAYDEALASLERALSFVPLRPEYQEPRLRLLRTIADTMFRRDVGLSAALLARIRRSADAAGAAGVPGEQGEALTLLAADLIHSGRPGEARRTAQTALAVVHDLRGEIKALIQLARAETASWDWPAAEKHALHALQRAQGVDSRGDDLTLWAGLALAINDRWGKGALRPARDDLGRLLEQARGLVRRTEVAQDIQTGILPRLLWELVWQDLLVGEYTSAHGHLRELEGTGLRPKELMLATRSLICLRQGDIEGALAASGVAMEITQRLGLQFPNCYSVRSACLLRAGRLPEARQMVRLGQAASRHYTHVRDRADSALRFGDVLRALGELKAAKRAYHWVLGTFSLPHVLGGLRGMAAVQAQTGDGYGAARCCGAVLAHGGSGIYEEAQAQAVLTDLMERFPMDDIGSAFSEGATTPLGQVVQQVRARPAE